MPSFSQVDGVWVLDSTPSGVAGAKLQLNAQILGSHLVATADAHTIAAITGLTTALAGKQAAGSYAAATHTHAAGDIASGTVATARLGSGTASSGTFLRGDQTWAAVSAGTVTSVALTLPGELSVSGSPVTGSGTLAATWATQTTGKVLAAPNGSTGTPTFRALAAADIPALDAAKVATGTFDVARIGSGTPAAGKYVDGTGTWTTLPGGSTPTLADVLDAGADAAGFSIIDLQDVTADGTVTAGGFTGNGGNLTNIVAANIQSYPADGTKVLRGDGVWAVPPLDIGGVLAQGTDAGGSSISGLSSLTASGAITGGSLVTAGTVDAESAINSNAGFTKSGVQVVGAQGAAVADPDQSDLTSVGATVQDLLNRLRAHGLIAT